MNPDVALRRATVPVWAYQDFSYYNMLVLALSTLPPFVVAVFF